MQFQGDSLKRKLNRARLRWRGAAALTSVILTASVVILLLILGFQWDRHFPLTSTGRVIWLALITGSLVAGLSIAAIASLFGKITDMRLAAAVEHRFPSLKERLLTVLDLAPEFAAEGPASGSANFSGSLIEALKQETESAASSLDFRHAISLTPMRRGIGVFALSLLLLSLNLISAGPAFAVWISRLAHPYQDIAPYAATRLMILPKRSLLPMGDSDLVTIKTWGEQAAKCEISVHKDGDPSSLNSQLTSSHYISGPSLSSERNIRLFQISLKHLTHSVTLIAYANDGRSNERTIIVAPRPTLLHLMLTIHYPAYTRHPSQTLDVPDGSISAPRGSQLQIVAVANNPLQTAECLVDNQPYKNWKVSDREAYGTLPIWKNETYSLSLTDRNGFDNTDRPVYSIRAEHDAPPTVTIDRPAVDLDLVPDGSLPLIAHASDDYGVNSMELLYSKHRDDPSQVGAERTKQEGKGTFNLPGPTGSPTAAVQQRWHVSSTAPNVGDVISYLVTATDNDAVDGPQTSHSLTYHIHVVSITEMQQRLKEALEEEQRSLLRLKKSQDDARQLASQARKRPDSSHISQAEQTQRAVSEQASALAQQVQRNSDQLQNNAMTSPSELKRRDEAAQTLQKDSQQKMPGAANSLQNAETASPISKDQSLQNASAQQQKIKTDLAHVQQLLSRSPSAAQMAKQLAQMAQQQQQLADGSRAIAEDLRSSRKTMAPEDKMGLQTEKQLQSQLHQHTQQIQRQLQRAAQEAHERGDQPTEQALKQADQALKQGQAQAQQEQAEKALQHNSPSNAAPSQDKAAEALQRAANAVQKSAGNQNPSQSPSQRLEQAARDLRQLAQKQQKIADQTRQKPDSNQSHSLGKQENQLNQQAQQMQPQLKDAPSAQQNLQGAEQNLQKSGQQLQQGSPQSAQTPSQNAAQQLQRAAQQAERAAQQLKQEQAASELADKVERLAQLQHGLLDATKRIDKDVKSGNLGSNEMHERRQVAERQSGAEQEAQDLAGKFPAPAFQRAMRMAAGQMNPATKNLNRDDPDTGAQTQQSQDQAARTLDVIARALKKQAQNSGKPNQNQQQNQQNGGQQQSASPQQSEMAEALGELLLSQGLQQDLRQDTGALDKQRSQQPEHTLTPDQQRQLQQMDHGQKEAQRITGEAGSKLDQLPDAQQEARQAQIYMGRASEKMSKNHTGTMTQGHQDAAIQSLNRAVQQLQQALQQKQQQQEAMQQAMQGAPMPQQQPGNQPQKGAFTRLEGTQTGAMSQPNPGNGKLGALNQMSQRALNQGRRDKTPPEYQSLVNQYYKSLAEKKKR